MADQFIKTLPSLMHFGSVYRKDLAELCKLD